MTGWDVSADIPTPSRQTSTPSRQAACSFPRPTCNSPQCRPSRTSLNYGVYPFKTGTYFNAKYPKKQESRRRPCNSSSWTTVTASSAGARSFTGTPGKVGDSLFRRPRDPKPPKGEDNFNAMRAPNDGYALDVADEEMGDFKVARWATREWKEVTDKPLFMSVGFFRPHRPLQVPKPWFDQFPLASIRRPAEPEGGGRLGRHA